MTQIKKVFVISGGFGDCINQIGKIIALYHEHMMSFTLSLPDTNVHWKVHIIYIRDTVDEQILDKVNPLTRDYASWVCRIAEINNFSSEVVTGDQKALCELYQKEHPEYIILGPNMDYSLKIFEPQRQLYIGTRPYELNYVPMKPITFDRNTTSIRPRYDVVIQVRFGTEYPTKTPNACWNDVSELVRIIRRCEERGLTIGLMGETKQNINALKNLVTDYDVNEPIEWQYNLLLDAKKIIGFAGWVGNLASLSGIPLMRMHWDDAETKLQVPAFAYENITSFTHQNLFEKLDTFLDG